MKARRGQRLDAADRQQVADRVPRQAASADLIPIDIKTRAWPFRELFEIEIERWCEQALVNRQLPDAASGIGECFRDVSDAQFDTSVLPLLAHAAPVAGEPLPLENSILRGGGFAEGCEYGANDHERGTAGSHEKCTCRMSKTETRYTGERAPGGRKGAGVDDKGTGSIAPEKLDAARCRPRDRHPEGRADFV